MSGRCRSFRGKESPSFLKKRSKKLFPGALRAQLPAPQAFPCWNACGAEDLAQGSSFVRSTRETFFASFFQKRSAFPFPGDRGDFSPLPYRPVNPASWTFIG
jgi:hypothetical protein